MDQDAEIKDALTKYKKIAVVGLSPDPDRPSYGVSQYMQAQGYAITPVRPGGRKILGVEAIGTLDKVPRPVEIVNVFRKSDAVPEIVDALSRAACRAPDRGVGRGVQARDRSRRLRAVAADRRVPAGAGGGGRGA